MGKAIRESSLKIWLGQCSDLGVPICKPRKVTVLVCVCERQLTGWEETRN